MNAICSRTDIGAKHYQQFLTCELQWTFYFHQCNPKVAFFTEQVKAIYYFVATEATRRLFLICVEESTDKGGADSCPNMPATPVWKGKKGKN